MRLRTGVALACTILLFLACGRRGAAEYGARQGRPGLASPASFYRPPADGIMTDDQIDRYLRVRRAAKGRSDADAARALGVSPEEVAWIRGRIVEAVVALDDRRVREATQETYAKAIAALRTARTATRDAERSRSLESDIAALERERATVRREDSPTPALAANVRRVARRRAELETVSP